MKKARIVILSVYCLFVHLVTFAQQRQPFGAQVAMEMDLSKLISNTTHYIMKVKGKKVGSWEWQVKRRGRKVTFKDISILDGQVREDALIMFDAKLMEVTSMDVKMKFNGGNLIGKVKADGTHIKADYVLKKGEQTQKKQVDTTLRWVARPLLIGLMPYIKLKPKQVQKMNVFSLTSANFWKMQLEVLEEVIVRVPAGEFQTQKIALRSKDPGSVSNIIYVSKSLPRKIIRVDVVGRGMKIELVK
ncbi:hypothetical protein BKI52_06390 [marine bacterium AO1-C]|nr:hypothetical protein BKI52_06390 [marine bacterium AO1-C]